MEKNQSTKTGNTENTDKPLNVIKIGFNTRVRNVIKYGDGLLKEKNFRSLNLSAIGGAIGTLVNAAEVLRILNPDLFEVMRIGTVEYQTVDNKGSIESKRIYPKLEIELTLDTPKGTGEGNVGKYSEEERKKLQDFMSQQNARRQEQRGQEGEFRERGGQRGSRGFRGSRGGQRGSFRGGNRGGFRGSRGGNRGSQRGGYREESRGGYREESRGGFGEGNRGGFRGSRGSQRGSSRGGFRGGNRGGQRGGNYNRDY